MGGQSTDELLPPDIPKNLRGRPRKMRRNGDWEGGNRSQSTGLVLQMYNNKRIMHCSLCGQDTHKKTICLTKNNVVPDEET